MRTYTNCECPNCRRVNRRRARRRNRLATRIASGAVLVLCVAMLAIVAMRDLGGL